MQGRYSHFMLNPECGNRVAHRPDSPFDALDTSLCMNPAGHAEEAAAEADLSPEYTAECAVALGANLLHNLVHSPSV